MTDSIQTSNQTYGTGIRRLHWLLFGLLSLQYLLVWMFGWFADRGSSHDWVVATHKSVGVVILLVAAALLVSRLAGGRPSNASLPGWQQRLSVTVHGLIYLLMLAQPVIGVLMTMDAGHSVPLFGLFTIPPLIAEDSAPSWLFSAHGYVGWTLFWLIALHIVAALYHRLLRRDGVLDRMLPGRT